MTEIQNRFEHLDLGFRKLFRISGFVLRISRLCKFNLGPIANEFFVLLIVSLILILPGKFPMMPSQKQVDTQEGEKKNTKSDDCHYGRFPTAPAHR